MPRFNNFEQVRILSIDGKKIMKFVSQEEACSKREETHGYGAPKYAYGKEWVHGKGFVEWLQMLPVPKVFKSSNSQSPSSITFDEMQANGLSKRFKTDEEDEYFTDQAKDKIQAWPFVGDPRAVRVCPAT